MTSNFQKQVNWYFKYQKYQKIAFWLILLLASFYILGGLLVTNTYKTRGLLLSNPKNSEGLLLSLVPTNKVVRRPVIFYPYPENTYLCSVKIPNEIVIEAFCEKGLSFEPNKDVVAINVVVMFFGALKYYYLLSDETSTLTHHSSGTPNGAP